MNTNEKLKMRYCQCELVQIVIFAARESELSLLMRVAFLYAIEFNHVTMLSMWFICIEYEQQNLTICKIIIKATRMFFIHPPMMLIKVNRNLVNPIGKIYRYPLIMMF